MELDDNEDFQNSDEEIDDATHAKLIRNVLNLNSKQFVKKPSRTEPTVNISEYDLVKRGKNVHLRELARALKGRGKKHVEIERKIRKVGKKGKTLPKPLEKPQADRIRRTVGYEKAKEGLDKWEPVVTSMRAASQIKFPLQTKVNLTNEKGDSKWRMKSDLEKELEEIQPKVEVIEVETAKKFPMSVKEMMEKRRESAKLRAYQSYKEAKARRQNKIKSKKYHRIQKRERVKQQMKEFELLQKTDPQAALEKLEEIEKARALERISLRHKGTGKWAKNKQIRAKYDKESRQVLAQQLAISRDLTQKQKLNGSDSEGEEKEGEDAVRINHKNSSNPWINGANIKVSKEVDDFVSGYRKYWEDKNGVKCEEGEPGQKINGDVEGSEDDDGEESRNKTEIKEYSVKQSVKGKRLKNNDSNVEEGEKLEVKQNKKVMKRKRKESGDDKESCKIGKKIKSKPEKEAPGTSEWNVDKELVKFDTKLQEHLQVRYNVLKKELAMTDDRPQKKKRTKPTKKKPDLTIPVKPTKPIIDEELGETTSKGPTSDVAKLKMILDETPAKHVEDIDPEKFIRVKKKTTELDTEIPDLVDFEDNEEEDQKDVITEAFEDDDIADSFRKDKRDEINKNKVGNVDLSLPGWGSWGGKDIKVPTRKKRRFMMKFPKKMHRKDKNKGDLIIKEGNSKKLKPHLVSEVPFPFKSVKDYEASIRAPIGRTFVPEIAHRKMIQPAVVSKMGAIIEPMTEDVLLKKKK